MQLKRPLNTILQVSDQQVPVVGNPDLKKDFIRVKDEILIICKEGFQGEDPLGFLKLE